MNEQLDLLEWAESRPTAEIVDFIPHVVRQIVRQRHQPRINRGGELVQFLPAVSLERKTA